jgi:parallel beta-helix repeat protein
MDLMRNGGSLWVDDGRCDWLLLLLALAALAVVSVAAAPSHAQTEPPASGDWTVADDTAIEGRTVLLKGNLTVADGGHLTLANMTLVMDFSLPTRFNITVESGGWLELKDLDHDPLTTTDGTVVKASNPNVHYLWFCNAGSRLLISCSVVRDCGVPQPYRRGLIIDTSDARIENSTFEHNNYGIYVRSSSPRIENTTFAHNEGYGLYEYQGTPLVQWCTFTDNFDTGAWVVSAQGARFSNCTFSDHSWAGMNVSASTLYVEDCIFHNNTQYGLRCYIGCRGTFARCDISVGAYVGLYLGQDCSPDVVDCDIHGLGGRGIWVYTARPLLERVWVSDCSEGLFLYNSDLRAESCTFEGSDFNGVLASDSKGFTLANCTIRDNGNNGVFVGTAYTGTGRSQGTVLNCTITDNRRAGIFVNDRSSCHVVDANFSRNGMYALYCDGTGRAEWDVMGSTVCANESVRIAGNITVARTGDLTLVNTTVVFNMTVDYQYNLKNLGGTIRILDGDGDRMTKADATVIMGLQPPFGARPSLYIGYNGFTLARNSYLIGARIDGWCDVEGCEFQERGSGVSMGVVSPPDGRVDNCSFSECEIGVQAVLPFVGLFDYVISGCAFSRCLTGVLGTTVSLTVVNCTFVTCRMGVWGNGVDGTLGVNGVRFLNCAECVVVTYGTVVVNDTQMRQSSGYGVRLERADATLVGLLIDTSATMGLVANDSIVEIDSCQFSGNPISAITCYNSSLRIRHTTLTGTGDDVVWLSGGQARLDDSYIGGPAKLVLFARSDAHIEAYNTTMPADPLVALDTSTIDVWWQFRVRVVVQGGLPPPPPVLVVVRDSQGEEEFNATAAADGSTPWVWARQYHVTQSGLGARTPYSVTVTVTGTEFHSSFNLKARTDHTLTIPLTLVPVVSYTGPVDEGVEVAFDGSASVGVPYPVTTWEWDPEHAGDFVTKATGKVLRWAFAANGQYEVALRVTDTQGVNNTTTVLVTVRDTAPLAFFVGQPPSGALEDQPITLEGRYEATVDPVILQEWDFGDGGKVQGAYAVHAWTMAGPYTVRFTVVDSDGSTDTIAFALNVTNVPPVAVAPPGPLTVGKRDDLLLDGARSHDTPSDNGTLTYVWQLGDGHTMQGAQVYYIYTRAGNYTVTLTVTDRHGASSADSVTVVVTNEPPHLGAIADVALRDTDAPYEVALAGIIGDLDDDAANLTVTVSVSGSQLVTVVAHRNATAGWTLTVTPREGKEGRARVTVALADPDGARAERTFNVTLTRTGGVMPILEEGWPWLLLILVVIVVVAIAIVVLTRRRGRRDGADG